MRYLSILFPLLLGSCTQNPGLSESAWELQDAPGVTLAFDTSARMSGRAPCNGYFGGIEALSIGELRFGPIASTKVACPELAAESAYFQALRATRSYVRTGDRLILQDGSGAAILTFKARRAGEKTR